MRPGALGFDVAVSSTDLAAKERNRTTADEHHLAALLARRRGLRPRARRLPAEPRRADRQRAHRRHRLPDRDRRQPVRARRHRHLAARSGVDADQLDRPPSPAERNADLLLTAFELSRNELATERGAAARAYLERRGIPPDRIADAALGVMPAPDRSGLPYCSGYRDHELATSGLVADSRWPRRVVGAWRDERRRVATLWTRALDDNADDRYLYLRGAPRAGAIPYGLSDLTAAERAEVTLVEGVMDVHVLRAHGVHAVPRSAARPPAADSRRLAELHIEQVVLAFDNDAAGRTATINAIDVATHARDAPDLWVIDPDLYGSSEDPCEVVRNGGARGWEAAAAGSTCAITWRALEMTGPIAAPEAPRPARRARPRRSMAQRPSTASRGRADRRVGHGGGDPWLRPRRGSSRLPYQLLAT